MHKITNPYKLMLIESDKYYPPSVPYFKHLGKRYCPWCGSPTFWLRGTTPIMAYEVCSSNSCCYFQTRVAPEGLEGSRYKKEAKPEHQGFTLLK